MITYKFRFSAKPGWLAWAMEPVMFRYLKRETAKRLEALAGVWSKGGNALPKELK